MCQIEKLLFISFFNIPLKNTDFFSANSKIFRKKYPTEHGLKENRR